MDFFFCLLCVVVTDSTINLRVHTRTCKRDSALFLPCKYIGTSAGWSKSNKGNRRNEKWLLVLATKEKNKRFLFCGGVCDPAGFFFNVCCREALWMIGRWDCVIWMNVHWSLWPLARLARQNTSRRGCFGSTKRGGVRFWFGWLSISFKVVKAF